VYSDKSHEIAFVIPGRYDYDEKYGARLAYTGVKMKIFHLNKYSSAAILFLLIAAFFIGIALIYNLSEFIIAAFVISGMICVMMGMFMLTFSGSEPLDPNLVGFLPVQGCMNLCRIASELNIQGNAYFLPPRETGETRVMQFNPAMPYGGTSVSAQKPFPDTGPRGLVTIPSCDPLIQRLAKRNNLVIPDNEENLMQLIRETIGEIFEFAPRVTTRMNGNTVMITFQQFRFISGCQLISQESPGCCSRSPCPACSICGVLLAAGTDKVVALETCSVSASARDINLVFRILPLQDPH
jgi:hypothetical protein